MSGGVHVCRVLHESVHVVNYGIRALESLLSILSVASERRITDLQASRVWGQVSQANDVPFAVSKDSRASRRRGLHTGRSPLLTTSWSFLPLAFDGWLS